MYALEVGQIQSWDGLIIFFYKFDGRSCKSDTKLKWWV